MGTLALVVVGVLSRRSLVSATVGANTMTREEKLTLLADLRTEYATYHHHKETSAWAVLVLLAVLVLQAVAIGVDASGDARTVLVVGSIVFIVLVGIVALLSLKTQLKLQRFAANVVAACQELRINLATGSLSSEQVSLELPSGSIKDRSIHSSYILPQRVLDSCEQFDKKGGGSRTVVEVSIWLAWATVLLFGLGAVIAATVLGTGPQ